MKEIDKIEPDYELKEKYKDKIVLAWAGRLYKWKGVKNSIRAIKSLPKEIKEKIIFLIIGGGEDFACLQKLSKGEETIKMPGNLPREKAISILKIADVYLHSSYSGGGLSTSLLEAMYCGCAVIATPNEGADEIVEDNINGFLIEKSDSKLISEKLKEVLNKNTAERRETAKNFIRDKFNWSNAIEAYQQIFDGIIKK